MLILTVWKNSNTGLIHLHQLSDDPADGTPEEQIAYLDTLETFVDLTCVSPNYTGAVPDTDADLWRWDGNAITSSIPVPEVVSARQALLALNGAGLLDNIEAAIKTQPRSVQISWEKASEFRRDNQLLNTIATSMGFANQLDALFIAAAKL